MKQHFEKCIDPLDPEKIIECIEATAFKLKMDPGVVAKALEKEYKGISKIYKKRIPHLPNEILEQIFLTDDPKNLSRRMQVSTGWRQRLAPAMKKLKLQIIIDTKKLTRKHAQIDTDNESENWIFEIPVRSMLDPEDILNIYFKTGSKLHKVGTVSVDELIDYADTDSFGELGKDSKGREWQIGAFENHIDAESADQVEVAGFALLLPNPL